MDYDFQQRLIILDEVDSTNETLFRGSPDLYPVGTALLARRQKSGRGRADRTWVSGLGGMYLSVVLGNSQVTGLALLGALVVNQMGRKWGLETWIRWPNDVYLGGQKLAGVLPQVKFQGTTVERAVLGVGLNVCQSLEDFGPELSGRATTLSHHLPERDWKVVDVAREFLDLLAAEYEILVRCGTGQLFDRCQEFLEGRNNGLSVWIESGGERVRYLGSVSGLGLNGELTFQDGSSLDYLRTDERLALEPPLLDSAGLT